MRANNRGSDLRVTVCMQEQLKEGGKKNVHAVRTKASSREGRKTTKQKQLALKSSSDSDEECQTSYCAHDRA
jgi:hypothetical protein